MSPDTFSLDDFAGTARLFPLPNLVVFPHVVQPLHIFESRYVEMLEHAMADDRLLAMGVLKPGWESDYESRPPVESVVCLGRIVSHSPAEDGTSNILLAGIRRARIVTELPPRCSYREINVELITDVMPPPGSMQLAHDQLVEAFRQLIPGLSAQEQFQQLMDREEELGTLTDLIGFSMSLEIETRLQLLAEPNVMQRAKTLLTFLQEEQRRKNSTFPPDFSLN